MANKTWKDMGFKIDNATGSLTAITSYINSQSLSAAITILDQTPMGATEKSKLNGLSDKKVDINGFWNSTVEGIFGPILNGTSVSKTAEFLSYTGRYYNGSVVPSNIQLSGSPDTLQTFSATLEFTDTWNRTSVGLS